jgi:hypothetical protein
VYFKQISSGHIKYETTGASAWSSDICMSERWTRDAVRWMIKKRWITVNTKKKYYRIISYKQLCRKLELEPLASVLFENDDYEGFRQFLSATVITDCLKIKKLTDRKNQSVSRMADTNMNWHFYSKGFHSLPIAYIAKRLGICNSRANKIKKWAIESKTVFVKKNTPFLKDSKGRKIGVEHLHALKVSDPIRAGRLRTNGKYIKIVEADLLQSVVETKKKRYKQ